MRRRGTAMIIIKILSDALLNLLDRLKGPYNLENVINPMNVQISEAIMIFQERGQNISAKAITPFHFLRALY